MNGKSLTTKQERFAQLWFSSGNKSEAYRKAYDAEGMSAESVKVEAHRVSANPNVTLAYAELVGEARKRNDTSVDTLDQMAKEAYTLAKAESKPSAMTQAVSVLAKLHGLNSPAKTRVEGDIHHTYGMKKLLDDIDGSDSGLPSD